LCIDTKCTIIGDFIVKYLSKFEAEFKKALGRESGPREDSLMKKNKGIKLIHRQTLDRQTLDTTNPGQDKPWTRQTLDRIEQGACTLANVN
jgi:hypothetical protein